MHRIARTFPALLAFAILALTLLHASPARAQASTIIGTVVDAATKQPIPDVVVTATSPNLQGEQTVVTDSQGNYRIPQLPPGIYTLRLEHDGYKPYSRGDIKLKLNRTIRVNVELLPEAIKDTGTPKKPTQPDKKRK